MYFEFLFRRAHSLRRVDRMYWSGVSLYSLTTCSNDVTVGTTGPIGSGLPQFGLPRRFAIFATSPSRVCDSLEMAEIHNTLVYRGLLSRATRRQRLRIEAQRELYAEAELRNVCLYALAHGRVLLKGNRDQHPWKQRELPVDCAYTNFEVCGCCECLRQVWVGVCMVFCS